MRSDWNDTRGEELRFLPGLAEVSGGGLGGGLFFVETQRGAIERNKGKRHQL